MSRFPRIFLQHKVWLEQWLSWNTWAAAKQVKCLVDERVTQRMTQAGLVVRKDVWVFAPLESGTWPEGSKVTLLDGRSGYITASVRREGGQLPLPEHWHIYTDIGVVASPAGGETVVLLRRTKSGTDTYGNDTFTTAEVSLPGAAVSRLESSEDNAHGTRVTVTATVIVAPGTVVKPVDRMRVRGLVYDVTGVAEVLDDPMVGKSAGVQVSIRRTTG